MISVVMPYWKRAEVTKKSLALYDQHYAGKLDFEVILVDDGSNDIEADYPWLKILRLPNKEEAKNPCLPFNKGVRLASGDVIVLTNPEIQHLTPILGDMLSELNALGPDGYVLAAAWCPEHDQWHCHTSVRNHDLPDGVGLHFCGMIHKALFDRIGGFDEAFRGGAAWEDTDFALRLYEAGAKIKIRDDLVVNHPKTGAQTEWADGAWQRNKDIFDKRWKFPITFACVQAGNYEGRGVEYVNVLHDMVIRNLSGDRQYKFVCFTDNAEGLDQRIEVRPLYPGLEGWWNKLALFKPGAFENGSRVIFFDLDTLIIQQLDDLARYRGPFACLRDFYRPDGLGSGVMLWEAGQECEIWARWVEAGYPRLPGGDQSWIEHCRPNAVRLQDRFPGQLVSYKAHCTPFPPKGASVVCFHGQPKPHNAFQSWVQFVWKVGGNSALHLSVKPNIDDKRALENVRKNENAAKWMSQSPVHEGTAVLCGSGPSADITLVRGYAMGGAVVFALNNACRWLNQNGITPDFQVILDSRAANVMILGDAKAYLIASQCDPAIFDALQTREVFQWHPVIDGIEMLFPEKPMTLVGGGTTVGLSAIALAYVMGFRHMALFGYDSSFQEDKTHIIPQDRTAQELLTFNVHVGDRVFTSNPAMARQAEIFPQFAVQMADLGCELKVYGDGLLPYIAQLITQPLEETHACV